MLADNYTRKVEGQDALLPHATRSAGSPSHIVGYSTQVRSRAGLEHSENDFLTGSNTNLRTVLDTTLDKLKGATIKGNDVILTLEPGAQRVALQALGGKCGAAVALEPTTGRVLVLASQPDLRPEPRRAALRTIQRDAGRCSPAAPLFNRATQGLYTPGSTFKVVTAAAALDSGKFTLDSTFDDPGYCVEYGKQVSNFADQSGPEVFGNVNFTQALQHSINAVFCDIGKALGARKIIDQAKRFGFYSVPAARDARRTSARAAASTTSGRLFYPKTAPGRPGPARFRPGARCSVTPLQMAMVAAAIANGGVVMRPYVVERVTAPDGGTVTRTKPRRARARDQPAERGRDRPDDAGGRDGRHRHRGADPGDQGRRQDGHRRDRRRSTCNTTWFITFAPADDPRVAVAVVLENQHGDRRTTRGPDREDRSWRRSWPGVEP